LPWNKPSIANTVKPSERVDTPTILTDRDIGSRKTVLAFIAINTLIRLEISLQARRTNALERSDGVHATASNTKSRDCPTFINVCKTTILLERVNHSAYFPSETVP